MMNSETSTDTGSNFRPWHLFVLIGLLAATVAVFIVRPNDPAVLFLLVSAIGSAAYVGFMIYRTLWPLFDTEFNDRTEVIQGKTRAALEREKTLLLRSIKELEFDRAMSKVSLEDFQEMNTRLRSRAIALIKQLDVKQSDYSDVIERELARLLDLEGFELTSTRKVSDDRFRCNDCGTDNERDAKFCKSCGVSLERTQ